jgi:hypothetical protein
LFAHFLDADGGNAGNVLMKANTQIGSVVVEDRSCIPARRDTRVRSDYNLLLRDFGTVLRVHGITGTGASGLLSEGSG